MLETLKITNIALISKSVVNFNNGFNVLTGETGAGKSLLVDALLFLTGTRADKTLIKQGEDYARVEGVFSIDINDEKIKSILDSVDIEMEDTLIVSRYFSLNGKNECRLNGELITLNILKKLSYYLIDIFGQNDSQLLLDNTNHLALIDEIIGEDLNSEKNRLRDALAELGHINNSIKELGGLDKDRDNSIQLLEFQIKEINDADLKENEEEELKSKISILENAEKIHTAISQSIDILDGEYPLPNLFKTAINLLSPIEKFDEDISNEKDRLYSLKYEMDDILSNLYKIRDKISYSENELDILNDRLIYIKDLERKYGNTISDILNKKRIFEDRLNLLINADAELESLRLSKLKLLGDIVKICNNLRNIRKSKIANFRLDIINELKILGMKNADFNVEFLTDINLDNIEKIVNENGADEIEFLFSANLGVKPRPLSKIISGGELSRFMLAFKSLQNVNTGKTCIFDEIDTGIGGEIGVAIGKKICDISRFNQVICITHLSQIAVFGDSNYKIEKYDEDNKTVTTVTLLGEENKVLEIARMLGSSSNITSIAHAKEIIDEAISYKKYIAH